jgi:hypothetical protein
MKTKDTLSALQTEADEIRTRIENDRKRFAAIQEKIKTLKQTADLAQVVGVPDGAFIGYGASTVRLRGKRATVKKLNRTRAVVDIDGESWVFPFDLLHTDPFRADLEATLNRTHG